MSDALYNSYVEDLFTTAAITGTAPATSYALVTLKSGDPAARVRWAVTTATITWTLVSPQRGDIFVIPTSSLDPGGTTAVLTNGAGLSVPVVVPARQLNGIPRTIALDLVLFVPNAATRTSATWNLVVTSNSVVLQIGGAVALYTPKHTMPYGVKRSIAPKKQQAVDVTQNEYFTLYRVNHATNLQIYDVLIVFLPTQYRDFENWYDACAGSALPGLLWSGLVELDPLYGIWQGAFEPKKIGDSDAYELALTFIELPKGKPL